MPQRFNIGTGVETTVNDLYDHVAAACGSTHHAAGCNTADPSACPGGAVCEPVSGGAPACFPPAPCRSTATRPITTGSSGRTA